MKNVGLIPALFLSAVTALSSAEKPLKKATFIPQWSPQAQFAGYYVAFEKGFYKKEGIDLTILPGGPKSSPIDFLKQKKADFASLWLSTAIQQRARGLKLAAIAQIMQRSALMLVARKSSGIEKPADLNGKTVGLWGADYQIPANAFFRKFKLDVRPVEQSFSVNLFLRGGVDVASAMWYNEYHILLNAGLDAEELRPFFFHEYGLNFPEDGLYVLEETRAADPELVRSFTRASLEGWRYAFAHPEDALEITLKYIEQARLPVNRAHQRWMLARMQDLSRPAEGKTPFGELDRADYEFVARELRSAGLIPAILEYGAFFVK